MSREPCKCCHRNKSPVANSSDGYGYNHLDGDVRQWAKDNQMPRSEFCVPVKGGKRFGGPDWVKCKCGDGRMGFTTRRRNRDEVKIEIGMDGQHKKSRSTLVRRKSAKAVASRRPRRIDGSKFGLISSVAISLSSRDPVVVTKMKREYRKLKRAKNRNNRARRGNKRVMKRAA